jgi:mycothiol synthase
MDERRYRIRGAEPRDREPEARIWNRVFSGEPRTAEELEQEERVLAVPPMLQVKVVAEDRRSGEAVGFGYLNTDPESFDPHTFWVGVMVDPDHQRRGVGLALAAAVEREAKLRGATSMLASARLDDARGSRFLARQGFVEVRRRWRSRLDVDSSPPIPDRTAELARIGVTLTTLAEEGPERPDVLRKVWELVRTAAADEPRIGRYTPLSFDLFLEWNRRCIATMPEAFFLARAGDRYVGACHLDRFDAEPESLHQLFTGTHPDWRGRGIATALKRRTVEFARAHGYRSIRTSNDSLNGRMWAINEKMGFRREREQVEAEKHLPGDESGGSDVGTRV